MAISVQQHFRDYMLPINLSLLHTRSKWVNLCLLNYSLQFKTIQGSYKSSQLNDDNVVMNQMQFNDAVASFFVSAPVVAVLVGILLDNMMNSEEEASRNDSGKHWWERFVQFAKDIRNAEFYSLPCELNNCFPSL